MIEVLKQALEALENSQRFVEASANAKMLEGWGEQLDTEEDAITSLRQAIAELESQEPKCVVIVEVFGKDWRLEYMSLPVGKHKLYAQQYLYTHPPQRTWQGLTKEQLATTDWSADFRAGALWAEAKLKEKNT